MVNEAGFKKVTIFITPRLHELMKEHAKRKRITLGAAYDQALQFYLSRTENYMGKNKQIRKVGS